MRASETIPVKLEASIGRVRFPGRPAEQGALAAGGLGAVSIGLGVDPSLAGAIAFGVGLVPGAITGLVNAGGIRGAARRLWDGRD
jgi:hypothetical protein